MQPKHREIATPPSGAAHNSCAPSPIGVGSRIAEALREGEPASTPGSPSRGGIFPGPDSTSHARESAYRAALEAQLALVESWYRRVLGIEQLLEHSAPVAAHGSVRRLLDGMGGSVRSLRQTIAAIDGGVHDEVQP